MDGKENNENNEIIWNSGLTTWEKENELMKAGYTHGLANLAVVASNIIRSQYPSGNGVVCIDKLIESSGSTEARQLKALVNRGGLPTNIRKDEYMEQLEKAAERAGLFYY